MTQKITDSGKAYALSRRIMRNVSERWGKSELTQFLELMEANRGGMNSKVFEVHSPAK
jgi:hypothetical protein